MKQTFFFLFIGMVIWACGGNPSQRDPNAPPPKSMIETPKPDDGKGIGEITNVELNEPLDQSMVEKGQAIYDMKCSACHKLGSNRLVGPGFSGVTDRRKPEWIMNMITNTEAMLDEDPEAQKMLEECLTRMPNQNVAIPDARDVLEFLLQNDAKKS